MDIVTCNSFQATTFSLANLAGDTITGTTINDQFFNLVDSTANVIGQLYNQAPTFVSTIYTSTMSNGWKWYYNPTSTTCMTLDNAGN